MDTSSKAYADPVPDEDLSLRDAAGLYDVSVRTLARRLRLGELAGHKTRGATGREWRVSRRSLVDAGYRPRPRSHDAWAQADDLHRLRQELAIAERIAAAERRRADDLDRRLGHALLESGRLRTALAAATGRPQPAEASLDAGAAIWLIAAVRGDTEARRGPELSVLDVPAQPRG